MMLCGWLFFSSEHPKGARPRTFALCPSSASTPHASPGRVDAEGILIQLESQDRSKWDWALIAEGFQFLEKSASENELSEFHLEAAIASLHSGTETYGKTDWNHILKLYDLLYELKPTPIVALNRAIATGQAQGPEKGLAELENIPDLGKLKNYPFYPASQGEFHRLAGHKEEARDCFETALKLARNSSEARFLERKLAACL